MRAMPRRLRLSIEGVPLHITQRGTDRQRCFFEDGHYTLYLGLLTEIARIHACDVHAYVLMTNHSHLLLTPRPGGNISKLMKNLGQRYVQCVNKTMKRTGTLWDGRFKSSLVNSESYLFHCHRYIERNPVRAGMVAVPAQYRWSSFSANALGLPSPLITPHPLYQALGENDLERLTEYRQWVECPDEDGALVNIRSAVQSGLPLGMPPATAKSPSSGGGVGGDSQTRPNGV